MPNKAAHRIYHPLALPIALFHISLTISISNTPWQDPLDINSIFFSSELLDATDHLNSWGRRSTMAQRHELARSWIGLVASHTCDKSCAPPVLHQQQGEVSNIGQRPRASGSTSSTLRSTQARNDCLPTTENSTFAVEVINAGKGHDSALVCASDETHWVLPWWLCSSPCPMGSLTTGWHCMATSPPAHVSWLEEAQETYLPTLIKSHLEDTGCRQKD